jgi:thiamine pyrophosphate-dependent acetolactate synthase large subunit-like protein
MGGPLPDPQRPARIIGSFLQGSMANALPHAIGAQTAFPGRQVISMSGDGDLSMLLGDLITLRDRNLPVKVSSSTTRVWGWSSSRCWWPAYPTPAST